MKAFVSIIALANLALTVLHLSVALLVALEIAGLWSAGRILAARS